MSGFVHVPWYATGFRGDQLQSELERVTPLSVRYGATEYAVFRGRDDRYRLLQVIEFDNHLDWERFWNGPEMIDFRAFCQGWFQVPIIYGWHDRVSHGDAVRRNGAGDGH